MGCYRLEMLNVSFALYNLLLLHLDMDNVKKAQPCSYKVKTSTENRDTVHTDNCRKTQCNANN